MECQNNELMLHRFIDGELSADDIKIVSEHIKNCSTCKQKIEQIKQLSYHLSLLPSPKPTETLFKSTLLFYTSRIAKPTLVEWWRGLGMGLRTTTCCLIITGFVLGLYLSNIHDQYQQTHIYNPEDVYIVAFEPGEGVLP